MIDDFIHFLNGSPTAWHAVENIRRCLLNNSFQELSEEDLWDLQPGGSYFVTKNGSTICAFILPQNLPKKIRLIASHTDSPGFKLKPHPELRKGGAILLGLEVYGSPLLSSWLNRDLGIGGRVIFLSKEQGIKEAVISLDRYPVIIPQLAVHLDREVNDKGLLLNKQDHFNALASMESAFKEKGSYLEYLLSAIDQFDRLLAHDLFLYPLERARCIGYNDTFISGYRIDSLASVHAAITAFLENKKALPDEIKMVVFWDNEEVGSNTAQGVSSPFFNQLLERIIHQFKGTREDFFVMLNRSTCISVDLAHALHPNYTDKHDAKHQPILGEGIVLKSNAQQRYATSAKSSLPIQKMAALKQLPLQYFASRNDIPCGTTIGPLQATISGMSTVDIGCSQLSMHSSRELMAAQDHIDMCNLLSGILNE